MSIGPRGRIFRWVAIIIAVASAIDPSVTSMRRTHPEVAIVPGGWTADSLLTRHVAEQLDGSFTVIQAPYGGAAGTVLVGDAVPPAGSELAAPVFAVLPGDERPTVSIEGVSAPARAPLEAKTVITARTRVRGARGQRLEASLRQGELIIDRRTLEIASNDARASIELSFVPTASGAVPLRVSAAFVDAGVDGTAAADFVVDVHEQRWAVLFFDPRPSWQSTFVRRAIERDPRFVVTSRVVTSRNIGTEAGHPPATLDDLRAVSLYDAIVIGAPDALGDRDVAGLEAYLQRRGGSVVLLMDQRASGAYRRLTGVREWAGATAGTGFAVTPRDATSADSTRLRVSEIAWPAELPVGAHEIARSRALAGDTSVHHPVLWRSTIGAGQLIVSGALDAWRYRDPSMSAFDEFWRTTIASAADAAVPAVTVTIDEPVVVPGVRTGIGVTLRDAALATIAPERAVRASVMASLETPSGTIPIRLWPHGPVGSFRGTFRAPRSLGSYRVIVVGNGARADAPLVVARSVAHARVDESVIVASWVGTRQGRAIAEARLAELAPALETALEPVPRRVTWHPMRSAWWIVPFALLLGAEWLSRRRRGLA